MKKPESDFNQCLAFSDGFAPSSDFVFEIMRPRIPGFVRVERAPKSSDKTGIDYRIYRNHLPTLAFDAKIRRDDYKAINGSDDLALEIWSVEEKQVPGWTRDTHKAADYILWYWVPTGRFEIVPFPPLCAIFQLHWQEWEARFECQTQCTGGRYHSKCVFVPRDLVWEHIRKWSNGSIVPARAA